MNADQLLRDLRDRLTTLQPDSYLDPAEIWSFLDSWEQSARVRAHQQAVAAEVERLQLADERRRREALVETQIKILSAVYEKANAYINLLVIAGYAAFFALWSFTKDINAISQPMRTWAVLAMLVSVCSFVGFETVKVMFTGWITTKRQRLFASKAAALSLADLEEASNVLQASIDRATVVLIRAWPWFLGFTATTAMVGLTMVVEAILEALFAGKI